MYQHYVHDLLEQNDALINALKDSEVKLETSGELERSLVDEIGLAKDAVFYRTYPLLYHKFENMVVFGQATYIHFVAQETRIIRKLFILILSSTISTFFEENI